MRLTIANLEQVYLSLYKEFCQVFFFFWIFNSTIIKFTRKSFHQIYSKFEFNLILFTLKQVTVIRNVIRNPALGLINRMSRWISISSARWTISVFDTRARYFLCPREGFLQKKQAIRVQIRNFYDLSKWIKFENRVIFPISQRQRKREKKERKREVQRWTRGNKF